MSRAPDIRLLSGGDAETVDLGRLIGSLLTAGDVVVLSGTLGAGKTTLTRGIARGMGIDDYITSPTFTLVNEYEPTGPTGLTLYHVDLYRTSGAAEALDLGIDDYLGLADRPAGVAVIEWAERALDALPPDYLFVRFERDAAIPIEPDESGDEARRLSLYLFGERYERRLAALTEATRRYAAGD